MVARHAHPIPPIDPSPRAQLTLSPAPGRCHLSAWQDANDPAAWFFAGQSTARGFPEYLQVWRSKNGSNWGAGFSSLGNLLPKPRLGGIANVPDFWRRTQTNLGADFLHFGDNQYFLGNFTRVGSGFGNTTFVPSTPAQSFGGTGWESHGFFDSKTSRFIWYGCVGGSVPAEPNVPRWDGYVRIPCSIVCPRPQG